MLPAIPATYYAIVGTVSAAATLWKWIDSSQEKARNEHAERMAKHEQAMKELYARLDMERATNAKLVATLPPKDLLSELHAMRASREALVQSTVNPPPAAADTRSWVQRTFGF